MGWLKYLVVAFLLGGCTTTSETQVSLKENANPKYRNLRNGLRYVIFVADSEGSHSEAAIEIENRFKEHLSDRGLVLVDFDQNSLSNILRNNGEISANYAKQVSSAADLIITGRFREERLIDKNINQDGTYRSRLQLSIAITESNSAIERGRFQDSCEELASSYESATLSAAISCGNKMSNKLIEKLLYIYGN